MYGVPKVHKSGLPMRPIVSTVSSHNYRLSKYLVELLKLFTVCSFSVEDSFTFTSEMGRLRYCNYSIICFDIVSLFTNIPLSKTIETFLNKVFTTFNGLYGGFDRKKFKQLFEICTRDNVFIFNEKLYK